jgi:hypothetical protein
MNRVAIATVLAVVALFSYNAATAAEWEKSVDMSLALTQSSYNNHWTGGEAGSVNWIANANSQFTGKLSPKFTWDNTIKLAFGQSHIQDKETKHWAKPEKSADRIYLESVGRFNLDAIVNPYAAATFESQFADNSVPGVTRYVNPFTLTESVGIIKVFSDTTYLTFITRLGVALRQYSNNAVVDTAAGTTKRSTSNSGGLEWVTNFSSTFAQDKMKYETQLRTFVAFFRSDSDKLGNNDWKTPHLAWEHTLSASVTKIIQVQLFVEMLYDKDISHAFRIRETLSLGLTYKLF